MGTDRTRSSTITKSTKANLEDSALATNSIHQTRGGWETTYMMLRLAVVSSPRPCRGPTHAENSGEQRGNQFLLGVLKTKGLLEVTIARRQE